MIRLTIDHEILVELNRSLTNLPPLFPFTEYAWLFYFFNGVIFLIVFRTLWMIFHLLLNKQHALTARAYNSETPMDRKILILGDSTAVGTGASKPEETIAGRLAHDFPNTQILNVAINGSRVVDLPKQIKKVPHQSFDLVIISTGGNDVWHLTRRSVIRKTLNAVLPTLNSISAGRVIFLLYNNIGTAPAFPRIIQFFLKRRCDKVQTLIRETCHAHNVATVDLFTTEEENPFLASPHVLFASDGVHPSSRGYELWYHRMWRKLVQSGLHY